MLAMMMVLISILATLPFMLDGDIANRQQASQADLVAQTVALQYRAAVTVCAAVPPPAACTDPGSTSDIDTSTVLDPDIVNAPLMRSGLVVARYDASGRIVAFVDQAAQGSRAAREALWGQVAAALIANSGGASGVGFWRASDGVLVGAQGASAYRIAPRQGTHNLHDGDPIMAQPNP